MDSTQALITVWISLVIVSIGLSVYSLVLGLKNKRDLARK